MTTATEERQKVTFTSGSRNLRIQLKGRRKQMLRDAAGNVVAQEFFDPEDTQPQTVVRDIATELGWYAESENGDIPPRVKALPLEVQFKNWKFETDDPDLIAVLRKHPNCNKKTAGFHEVAVPIENRMKEIAALTARRDVGGLQAIVAHENSGPKPRKGVLDAAGDAITALSEFEPEAEVSDDETMSEGEPAEAGSTDGGVPDDDPSDAAR